MEPAFVPRFGKLYRFRYGFRGAIQIGATAEDCRLVALDVAKL